MYLTLEAINYYYYYYTVIENIRGATCIYDCETHNQAEQQTRLKILSEVIE